MEFRRLNIFFTKQLFHWHENFNQRKMPWKGETNPYKIWLSEIILQQTRVAQGLSYYERFIENFPTIFVLAAASEDEVFRLWQGLGYYSRARNLHYSAQFIVANFNGQFPTTYKELLQLKGVGPYTAAAIASFAFKEKIAAIDGNVVRVLARFFGIYTPFDSNEGKKLFQEKAQLVLNETAPDIHNQAMMDFGANICKPQNPSCAQCVFQENCFAFTNQEQKELPIKSKKIQVKKRYFLGLHIEHLGEILIEKRQEKDIWKGLFQLPLLEVLNFNQQEISAIEDFLNNYLQAEQYEIHESSEIFQQKLSHQTIHLKVYHVKLAAQYKRKKNEIYTLNFSNFAFPKIFILYLQSKGLFLM